MDTLTLDELNKRIVGYNKRENEYWRRHATLAAYIVTATSGKKFKGRDLMPEVYDTLPVYTPEERQKELDEIRKSVGLDN